MVERLLKLPHCVVADDSSSEKKHWLVRFATAEAYEETLSAMGQHVVEVRVAYVALDEQTVEVLTLASLRTALLAGEWKGAGGAAGEKGRACC
jgi:hypothetical protein